VVIEPVQDLHICPVLKLPVDEVRLPHLVRRSHLKPRVGRSRTLARLRRDQPGLVQDSPDRGGRRSPQPFPFQMPRDRHRPRVEPVGGQPRAQRDHPLADQHRGRRSVRSRAARAGLERVQASFPIGDQKTMEMPAGEPVIGSGSGHGQLLGDDLENSNVSTRHLRTVSPPPDGRAAIAATASPSGLRLRDDRRNPKPQPLRRVRPMSRLMRDLSPGTYVLNPDTPLSAQRSPRTHV
jgi:hypothetical protein